MHISFRSDLPFISCSFQYSSSLHSVYLLQCLREIHHSWINVLHEQSLFSIHSEIKLANSQAWAYSDSAMIFTVSFLVAPSLLVLLVITACRRPLNIVIVNSLKSDVYMNLSLHGSYISINLRFHDAINNNFS